jgi:hypothetical protein
VSAVPIVPLVPLVPLVPSVPTHTPGAKPKARLLLTEDQPVNHS